MVVEFRARRDLIVDGLNAIPGIRCLRPKGAFYAFPDISGTGLTGAELAERLLQEAGVCVLAGTAFGGVGDEPHPDLVRELAGEPDEGAASGSAAFVERAAGGARRRRVAAVTGDRPKVFVARRIPDDGHRPDRRGDATRASGRTSCRRRAATLLDAVARLRRRPDAPHRPGRRRVPRRRRAAAEGRLELRRRLRQRRRPGLHPARDPGRQHARRPDRDDRRPRVRPADGRRPAPARGRPLRPRRASGRRGGRCCCSGPDVHGATIGIVGFGRIGQAVARRAHGLRDDDPVPRRPAGRRRPSRPSYAATFLPLEELLAAVGLRLAPRQPDARDAAA